MAKIETRAAVENLDGIIKESGAIMVARGDLGVEMGYEHLTGQQKTIIRKTRKMNRVVITATQMMESMISNPIPTRAEVSDVANAVFDGADAMMLSGESAAGRFPVKAVATMDRIICEAEAYLRECSDRESEGNVLGRRQFFRRLDVGHRSSFSTTRKWYCPPQPITPSQNFG